MLFYRKNLEIKFLKLILYEPYIYIMSATISPNTLLKVKQLFTSKNWAIEDGTAGNLSLFEKFCARLKLFTQEHQELIIELAYSFRIINLNEYLERFYDSLFCLNDSIFEKDKVFIYPLINPQKKISATRTKSANFLHYMLQTSDNRWISKKLIVNSVFNDLKSTFSNKDSCLILIDDFIGSGNTAIEVCDFYLKENINNENIYPENIKIVCIAAQQFGIVKIKNTLNIDVFSNIIMPKGITEVYNGNVLNAKIAKMEEIEKKLSIKAEYNFGYERSEALISFLKKTPNNTFPVFWHETPVKVAPFPRYQKYL